MTKRKTSWISVCAVFALLFCLQVMANPNNLTLAADQVRSARQFYSLTPPPSLPDVSIEPILVPKEPQAPAHFPNLPNKLDLPVSTSESVNRPAPGASSPKKLPAQYYAPQSVPIYSDPPKTNNSASAPNHLINPS